MSRLGSLADYTIIVVEPGEEIEVEDRKITIDNGTAVADGATIYMTQSDLDALKKSPDVVVTGIQE